jgi:hypothetical protein
MGSQEHEAASKSLPLAQHSEMDSRAASAQEFFAATHAELTPFVSDEATWWSFDYLELDELTRVIRTHYGVALDPAKLALPFWTFLDYLETHRTRPA